MRPSKKSLGSGSGSGSGVGSGSGSGSGVGSGSGSGSGVGSRSSIGYSGRVTPKSSRFGPSSTIMSDLKESSNACALVPLFESEAEPVIA